MKLTITNDALLKIKQLYQPKNHKLLLSFDDGVGPFSSMGVCSLDTSFQLLIVNAKLPTPDYSATIESKLGTIYYKKYSKQYLGDNLKLDFNSRYHTLPLSSNSEVIDSNVALIDLSRQPDSN